MVTETMERPVVEMTSTAPDLPLLVAMTTYGRPEKSRMQRKFCNRFLRPVFGPPDAAGNYTTIIGGEQRIAFMAHHDTVHLKGGKQRLTVVGGELKLHRDSVSDCLGADCTTGVWLILHMIKNKVPGVYVVHAGEECGGIGAEAIIKRKPEWLDKIEIAISLDRKATCSVITHQGSMRTASDTFAWKLAQILGETGHDIKLEPDTGGTFTDSAVYADTVSECTNLSVGYYGQHTKAERQDLRYAAKLAQALVEADWSALTAHRDPSVVEWDRWPDYGASIRKEERWSRMEEIVYENPRAVAKFLESLGYTSFDLIDEFDLNGKGYGHAAEYGFVKVG